MTCNIRAQHEYNNTQKRLSPTSDILYNNVNIHIYMGIFNFGHNTNQYAIRIHLKSGYNMCFAIIYCVHNICKTIKLLHAYMSV